MSIYRIIQEFVNNSIKHSKCKNIVIDLNIKPKALTLVMSDDGVGFNNTPNARRGNGLDNINLRVKYLQGEIDFTTEKNNGVMFNILIPL
jgi:signal transduction histidine kinase